MKWTNPLIAALALLTLAACSSSDSPDPQPPQGGAITLGQTIGVNTHLTNAGMNPEQYRDLLAPLAEAGVYMIRSDLTWATVEQTPGVYDFVTPGYDHMVEAAEGLGIRILFILSYANPLYGEFNSVADVESRCAFAAYATAAANRYGGRGHTWEIWNEPNTDRFWTTAEGGPNAAEYAALVESTVSALRAADPGGTIAVGAVLYFLSTIDLPGISIGGERWLQALADAGVLGLGDEVTLHFYRGGNPEGVIADVVAARAILDAAGESLPISSGEWGYSTYDGTTPAPIDAEVPRYLPAVTEERQASYIARMLLYNYSLGLPRSVYYDYLDSKDPDPSYLEEHFGIMTNDLVPKPAYTAISTLTDLLGDAVLSEELMLGTAEHGLLFERADGSQVTALWGEQQATWMLRAEAEAQVKILARDGSDMTPDNLSGGAQLTVEADDGPIYLIGDISVTSEGNVGQ
jgi:hypothetical protein